MQISLVQGLMQSDLAVVQALASDKLTNDVAARRIE